MAKEILVIAEHRNNLLRPETLELMAFGQGLAEAAAGRLKGVILACPAQALAQEMASRTGAEVLAVENRHLAVYNAEAYIEALSRIVRERKPAFVLVPHTATGFDFAPRLAVAIQGSCSTAVTGFRQGPPVSFLRSICNGKIQTEVAPVPETVSVLTVMPGAAKPAAAGNKGSVELWHIELGEPKTRNLGYIEAKAGALDLARAEVIVAAGRGIGGQEQLELVRRLAECFDKGALAGSRPVIDAGWLPLERQVGQTGQTVHPKLYIACGISGAIQHLAGMSGSELIVAINIDREANIFNIAHLGVVQDLHQFLPVLIQKIRTRQTAKPSGS